jgi:hypothetical protein
MQLGFRITLSLSSIVKVRCKRFVESRRYPYHSHPSAFPCLSLYEYLAHGDCQVPTHYEKDQRLGFWVHQQRREYAKFMEGKPAMITSKRIADLEHIGFTWEFKSMRIRKPYIPVKKRNKEGKRTTASKNKKPRNEETAQPSDDATTSDDDDESESSDDMMSDEEVQHLEV